MDAFDKLVAKHFPQAGPLQMLMEMVEEQLDGFVPSKKVLQEQEQGEEVKVYLPVMRITEDWGKVSEEGVPTEDRQIIEMFTKNIKGNSVAEKLSYLNNIISGEKRGAKLKEILGTMVVLEVLSQILDEFTESAGGFIFEAFLAGLFGGQSIQIIEPEEASEAAGKPITDVVLGDKQYSLKLLGPGTDVKGSFKNMVLHFLDYDHVIYLDARREEGGLVFGEFKITLADFLEVFYKPLRKTVTIKADKGSQFEDAESLRAFIEKVTSAGGQIKALVFDSKFPFSGRKATKYEYSGAKGALSEIKATPEKMAELLELVLSMDEEELNQYGPFAVGYSEQTFEGSKAARLFGSMGKIEELERLIGEGNREAILAALQDTPGFKGREQFLFTRAQAESISNFETIGSLVLGDDVLKQTWLQYGELLNATIGPVYEALNSFSSNINAYFLDVRDPKVNRRQRGMAAIKDTDKLKAATDNAVKAVEKEK